LKLKDQPQHRKAQFPFKRIAARIPLVLEKDSLHAYHLAWKQELHTFRRPQAKHIEHATWKGQERDNRKMERLNGEIQD